MYAHSFNFDGINIEDFGLHYAPENANTYNYNQSDFSIEEQSFSGHSGGYFYGTSTKPKQFLLRCYYENEHVDYGLFSKVNAFFKRGKVGKLVFADRPWIYYTCIVTEFDASRLINIRNGFVVIKLTAYYPFAMTDYAYISNDEVSLSMRDNSALFESNIMPATTFNSLTSTENILLYNGGNERASVTIDIGGDVGTGVTIENKTTDQTCAFRGLTTGSSSKYVEYNGLTGNTYWVSSDSSNGKNAFIYHNYGVIELEPAYPIKRDINVQYTSGSSQITCIFNGELSVSDVGKYIYIDGSFRKITSVTNGTTCIVASAPSHTGLSSDSVIVTMNEIEITPASTMNISYLAFKYKHTFA